MCGEADQLVTTKYQSIRQCNNYAVLQNIPCPKERNIVGKLLVDHTLSYALTTTADIPAIYLQQFWKTIRLVVNVNKTIRFTMDKKEITYTVDSFRSTLNLPVETPENPFIAPATMKFIQPFLKIVRYQGDVDKVSAFVSKFLAQPWQTMFKVFNRCLTSRTSDDQTKINILQIFHVVVNRIHVDYADLLWWDFLHCVQQKKDRLEEDYHFIKDDIPLVSVYTTGNVTVKGMLISNEFLTDDIHATPKYKEYEKEKLMEEDIEKMVDDKDEESYASEFADSLFLNEEYDFGTRLEPGSHKENPKIVDDDDDVEEKKDDKKDDKNDDDDNDDHTDHTLVKDQVTGSSETRKEKMQTTIPSPHRSLRTDLSSNKTISQELMANVSPTSDLTSQDHSKRTSSKTKILLRSIAGMSRRCGKIRKHIQTTFV
ncbi:hypothetical protein Tco_0223654 [Tanacetum coccineum]